MVAPDRIRMTAAEFLALPETVERADLIEGEPIVSPAPSVAHQALLLNIALLLRQVRPQGTTIIARADVHLGGENVVQPDVFWISAENAACHPVDGKYFAGAPDLVVEVVSPSTAHRDNHAKFALYERYSVHEYWIVDPVSRFFDVFFRVETALFSQGVFTEGQTFTSRALGDVAVDVRTLLDAR